MRWKWILGITAAIIVALIITAYIIIASYDFNKLKPRITAIAKEYTGRELTLGGDVKFAIGFSPRLAVENVGFQNAAWGSRPQMARIKKLEVQVALIPILSGEVEVKQLTILNSDIIIEIDKSGKSNLDFDIPKASESKTPEAKGDDETPTIFNIGKVHIENGKISYKDHQSGITETLIIESLRLETPAFGDSGDIQLKGNYNKIPFEITGSLGRLSGLLNPNEPWPLDLTVTALDSTMSAAGNITDIMQVKGIDLKLAAKGSDLANFQQITGEPLPFRGPFEVSGHLKAPALENVKISEIQILLGESKISGEVAIQQKSPRPRIDAKLNSKKLDLRPFISTAEKADKPKTQPKTSNVKKKKVFSDEPLDLQALQQIDANLSLRADQILGHRTALDNVKVNLNLQNGHLVIKPLTAEIGGGNISASLDLLAKGSHANLATAISARKLNLGNMLKKLEINESMEGTLDLDIKLQGQGNSEAALMAGLNGDVIAIMGEAKMPVAYLNLVGGDLTTSFTRLFNPFGEKIDRAQINCAVCDFNIKDGMAKSDVIIIDDPKKTLLSNGQINLKTEGLDFGIQTQPKEGIGTKETGKVSVSLSEITKPFKLGGTLANPSLGIDVTRTATTLGKVLLGPAGIASLFVSGSPGNENPCEKALKKAKEGTPEQKKTTAKAKDQKEAGVKKEEGLGTKIKNLFKKSED
jgi:uncharacterized protein involved in outer membrane biogenesis